MHDLIGDGRRAGRGAGAGAHEAARQVRLATSGHGFIGDMLDRDGGEPLPDLDALAIRVQDAWLLVHEARYRELGELLPGLMRACELAAWKGAEVDRPRAFRLLAELYQAVAAMMAELSEPD